MKLLQEIVHIAATNLEFQSKLERETKKAASLATKEPSEDVEKGPDVSEPESNPEDKRVGTESYGKKRLETYNIFLQLPQSDLRNLCSLLGHEGYDLFFIFYYKHFVLWFLYLDVSCLCYFVVITMQYIIIFCCHLLLTSWISITFVLDLVD